MEATKVGLSREYLNSQGYTNAGRYFGVGAPLYRYGFTDDQGVDQWGFVRGVTREAAKAAVRELHRDQNLRFHR